MTPENAAKILALVSVYDNRNFDEMTAKAWADALDGLELGDCLDAVRLHYRRSRQWLMPADVREHVRSLIRDRAPSPLAIESANLDPETVSERVEKIRAIAAEACKLPVPESPHPKVETSVVREARKVACPWCGAAAGAPCVNKANDRRLEFVHDKRMAAAGFVAVS